MSELSDKLLKSGIIERHTAVLLERLGLLPAGDSEKARENAAMTRSQMEKLAEDFSLLVDDDSTIKETVLDLDQLRWPTKVYIQSSVTADNKSQWLDCMIDHRGHYFFRFQDVVPEWFVVGSSLVREGRAPSQGDTILEVTTLFVGDKPVAIQVMTQEA